MSSLVPKSGVVPSNCRCGSAGQALHGGPLRPLSHADTTTAHHTMFVWRMQHQMSRVGAQGSVITATLKMSRVAAQGSVITATLIFFVVVVNYIGDVVKQLMATAADQQGGGAPGNPVVPHQPAALPAPPPPDRGHVLHAAPGGATQPSDADAAEGSAAGAEGDSASAGDDGEADGAASSDAPACTECSARRKGPLTAAGPAKTQPQQRGDPSWGGERQSADIDSIREESFGPRWVNEESSLTAQVCLEPMLKKRSLMFRMSITHET